MCGIFGIWPRSALPNATAARLADSAAASLESRGPDGTGVLYVSGGTASWHEDTAPRPEGGCDLMMLHRRLAIIDLSGRSAQPMSDATGRYWIVYNGEIYNYRSLRSELAGQGIRFRTEGDTEVLLEGWRKWGVRVLEKVVGMYAFGIYDIRERELTLVRDPIGIKPLYYVVTARHRVAFASDQTTLLQTGVAAAEPDWDGVMSGMLFRGSLRPGTVHRGMRAVEPGTVLVFRESGTRLHRYWDLGPRDPVRCEEGAVLEASGALLRQVVSDAMVSDVEVASLMSGGIDSTTLSAVARQFRPGLKAYTLHWDDAEGPDESRRAAAVAKRHGLVHMLVNAGAATDPRDLLEMFDTFEEPIGFPEPHQPMAAALAADGIRVVLNGLGPDELLAGYRYYRLLEGWRWSPLLRRLPGIPARWSPGAAWAASILQAPDPATAYAKAYGGALWGFDEPFLVPGLAKGAEQALEQVRNLAAPFGNKPENSLRLFSYLDLKIQVGTHHNHTSDRFLMRRSIEGRFPYLDIRWVEHCFHLPDHFKLRGRTQKWLLRRLAGSYLEPSGPASRKSGFSIPGALLTREPAVRALLEELVQALGRRGIVRPALVRETLAGWQQGRPVVPRMLYLANLERWLQNLGRYGGHPI